VVKSDTASESTLFFPNSKQKINTVKKILFH